MKTLELKLYLNKSQESKLVHFMESQRRVWNWGLSVLIEFNRFHSYSKVDKSYHPCCPVPWEVRWFKDGDDQWVAAPYSIIDSNRFGRPNRHPTAHHSCPLPQGYQPSPIDRDTEFSLTKVFAFKRNQGKEWLLDCPFKMVQGTVKRLCDSWAKYKKDLYDKKVPNHKKRKPPKFKSKKDAISISDFSTGGSVVYAGGYLKLPKLGRVKVRGLEKRWPQGLVVKTYHIKKDPSGYYVYLVGEVPSKEVPLKGRSCGLDAGVAHLITDDAGKHTDVPKALRKHLDRLKRLQRKASRQVKGSANQAKTYQRLARTHEQVRRERKGWHHKVSTYTVRTFDNIAVEDLNLAGMMRAPKAKPNEDGTGYLPNGKAAKSGLNKSLADAAIGNLYVMMESKAKSSGKTFVKVSPRYTSQTCSQCGTIDSDSRKSQSKFICTHCGHAENADVNAAKNIKSIAFG
jgi:putative transposase